jgi:NitT/TauT family transport system substrate-binding protein
MRLKSKIATLLISILSITILFTGCDTSTDDGLQEVRLNEVVRSVFYAPMYISISEGFFEDEGLKIDLSTGQGADKVMQNVLSNNADIGFCGPEQTIYIHNQGRENYPVIFAQLTKKDGSFLVGREEEPNFKWESLENKKIIGGRPGGVPEMALEYVLKDHKLSPTSNVEMVTNIDFTATAGAFKSGTADYVALFEPTASMLEKEGNSHIVASIGESTGNIAYTCFFSTKSYMNENPETIGSFTRAIYKGQQWFKTHTSAEIATSIESFFPGTDKQIIIDVVENYKEIDALSSDPIVKKDELNKLMDVIESYDSTLIKARPDFDKVVNNSFAEKVVQ